MQFVMSEPKDGYKDMAQLPGFEEATVDLLTVVLDEAGKLAEEVLAPLNQKGDQAGAKLLDGKVVATEGFGCRLSTVYRGWLMSISQSPGYGGGQGCHTCC